MFWEGTDSTLPSIDCSVKRLHEASKDVLTQEEIGSFQDLFEYQNIFQIFLKKSRRIKTVTVKSKRNGKKIQVTAD